MTSHKTFPIAGILFDSDGVLVDSHEAAATAWNHWARTWAPGFDFHRDAQHGRRLSDVVAELVGDGDSALATKVLTELEIEMATEVPAMAGAVDLLSSSPRTAGQWSPQARARWPLPDCCPPACPHPASWCRPTT